MLDIKEITVAFCRIKNKSFFSLSFYKLRMRMTAGIANEGYGTNVHSLICEKRDCRTFGHIKQA
jgi:hypothetical protein